MEKQVAHGRHRPSSEETGRGEAKHEDIHGESGSGGWVGDEGLCLTTGSLLTGSRRPGILPPSLPMIGLRFVNEVVVVKEKVTTKSDAKKK